jgi:diguanylate cyclase (GGDEF)-like protein
MGSILARCAKRLEGVHRHWIGGWLVRPFRSLSSRIVVSVFTAALVTGVAVTWISTRSIESYLRVEIDRKFPGLLRSTADRLELWYSQREVDLGTFARSETVVANLARLPGNRRAAEDLAAYLSYVMARFPQYDALLLLDRRGELLLEVGGAELLPVASRRELAAVEAPRVGPIHRLGDEWVQFASAPVTDAAGRRLATLHARIRSRSLETVLLSAELGASGGVYVLDESGEVVLRSPGSRPMGRYAGRLPLAGQAPLVTDYARDSGGHVVGSALAFERFGWTLLVEDSYDEAFAPVVAVIREILTINLGIVAAFALVALHMARSIVRPILALSAAAGRIAKGDIDVSLEPHPGGDEIGVLTDAFNEMTSRLRDNQRQLEETRLEIEDANARLLAQNQELHRAKEVFQQLSITDELTKLHNHRFFLEHLPREIRRCERAGERLSLVLIDIDDFKRLNDRFGHSVGDAVLRKVADVMNAAVREADLLARYGGEEFVLLATQTGLDGALALAEKVRLALAAARFSIVDPEGRKQIRVTASFGVAEFHGDAKALFNDADRALYEAKAAGKDCVMVARPSGGFSGV